MQIYCTRVAFWIVFSGPHNLRRATCRCNFALRSFAYRHDELNIEMRNKVCDGHSDIEVRLMMDVTYYEFIINLYRRLKTKYMWENAKILKFCISSRWKMKFATFSLREFATFPYVSSTMLVRHNCKNKQFLELVWCAHSHN